jgi:hypothetical protein
VDKRIGPLPIVKTQDGLRATSGSPACHVRVWDFVCGDYFEALSIHSPERIELSGDLQPELEL